MSERLAIKNSEQTLKQRCSHIFFSPIKRIKEYVVNEDDEIIWERDYEDIDYDLLLDSDEDDVGEISKQWEDDAFTCQMVNTTDETSNQSVESVNLEQTDLQSYVPVDNSFESNYALLFDTNEDHGDRKSNHKDLETTDKLEKNGNRFNYKNKRKPSRSVKSQRSKKKAAGSDAPQEYCIEKVLNRRTHCGEVQYLIQWKGFPLEHNTWEPEKNLHPTVMELIKDLFDADAI